MLSFWLSGQNNPGFPERLICLCHLRLLFLSLTTSGLLDSLGLSVCISHSDRICGRKQLAFCPTIRDDRHGCMQPIRVHIGDRPLQGLRTMEPAQVVTQQQSYEAATEGYVALYDILKQNPRVLFEAAQCSITANDWKRQRQYLRQAVRYSSDPMDPICSGKERTRSRQLSRSRKTTAARD